MPTEFLRKNEKNFDYRKISDHELTTYGNSGNQVPHIKLESFAANIKTWSRCFQQFESSIDKNQSVTTIKKHIFLHGYLEWEPKRLVDGIAVTVETYEQTLKILLSRYGDRKRIIQTHVDYFEDLQLTLSDIREAINFLYNECHRRIEALKAQVGNIDAYGRVLEPKFLRAFRGDICRRWLIHVNREIIPETSITKLTNTLTRKPMGLSKLGKFETQNLVRIL